MFQFYIICVYKSSKLFKKNVNR